MRRKQVICSCVPHGSVREYQRNDARTQIVNYVPAVSVTANTFLGLQWSAQHVAPMWPATLHTMPPVRQFRPIRPIFNLPSWWRRQRCSVVLWTITCNAHLGGASTLCLCRFRASRMLLWDPWACECSFSFNFWRHMGVFLYILFLYMYLTYGRWSSTC